jgi:hypothetical protein
MLGAHLQDADPLIYEILQKACLRLGPFARRNEADLRAGETTTKAFYKSYTVREFYLPGRP